MINGLTREVRREEDEDGLLDKHDKRPLQAFLQRLPQTFIFDHRPPLPIARATPPGDGFVLEQRGPEGLRHEGHDEDETRAVPDGREVVAPPPAEVGLGDVGADDGAEDRPDKARGGEER